LSLGVGELDPRSRINIATGLPKNLSSKQRDLVESVNALLAKLDLNVVSQQETAFTLDARYRRICRSDGVIVFAFSQWKARRLYRKKRKPRIFPSEFAHINNALTVAASKPLLVFRERSVDERGSLRNNAVPANPDSEMFTRATISMPAEVGPEWLDSDDFCNAFEPWLRAVQNRKHVFLAYSSSEQGIDVARHVSSCIEKLGLTVLDWHTFERGENIYTSIEKAEKAARCGIFLFTPDDQRKKGNDHCFVPRDNVVLEFAYFAGVKGKSQVLILK
jgi:hypothetical protein